MKFPIMKKELQRFTCRYCGAPLACTPEALAINCSHCHQVTAIYDTHLILRDGMQVYHVPDKVKESTVKAIEAKQDFPDNVEFSMGWSPHWYFKGEIEAFLSGRRYSVGVGGDRVYRVTHQDTRVITGRLLNATFQFPREDIHFDQWELRGCEEGMPPGDDGVFAPHIEQETALDSFENQMKRELLREKEFQTEQCDRFEVICRHFRQSLVYVPVRVWHVPNKYYESQRRWVVHYGHSGNVVKTTSTLEDLVRKGERWMADYQANRS